MKKHISVSEVEKSLRIIWDVANAMEVTLLGDNMFMFTFYDARTCEHVFEKQPWNYRGSIVLLDRIRRDECPLDFALYTVTLWIQANGLQLWAMNKTVGEEIGALLRRVLEVCSDAGGTAIGGCICICAMVNIHNHLLQWTNMNVGEAPAKSSFAMRN